MGRAARPAGSGGRRMLSHPSIGLPQFLTGLGADGLLQAGLQAEPDEDPSVRVPVLSVGWIKPLRSPHAPISLCH